MIIAKTSYIEIFIYAVCFIVFLSTGIVMCYYRLKFLKEIYRLWGKNYIKPGLYGYGIPHEVMTRDPQCAKARDKMNKVYLIGFSIVFLVIITMVFTALFL